VCAFYAEYVLIVITELRLIGNRDRIIAGYHYDLNFMTIHGKSRYPGLYVWTRDGTKKQVKVPDGCLLIQVSECEYEVSSEV
jgi:isopenicillin N synthase-like dioxygenase